jgi:hypothetical protein
VLGSAFHWKFGAISNHVLLQLLEGGVPGVVIGCLFARHVPARKLKFAIALIAIFAGLQLVWSGSRSMMAKPATKTSMDVGLPAKALAAAAVATVLLDSWMRLLPAPSSHDDAASFTDGDTRPSFADPVRQLISAPSFPAFPGCMTCCSRS